MNYHENRRSPREFRVGGNGGHPRFFEGQSPRGGGGFWPMVGEGGGFRPIGDGRGFGFNHQALHMVGQKRGYPFLGRGESPDHLDNRKFAKLFVGSVPRTATEEDIRPLFERHGNVMEVALIKDKRTGQQQGCCFIKYATSEEANQAIQALHNQQTVPGGVGPIQVRYADGERERIGAFEFKLFVGSLNKHATEKEVEEIFSPYGRVEDVYLMRDEFKQSRGCGFVKYSNRDVALAAIKALHGIYMMRGCDQPLIVRFADSKRPRFGDSRSTFAIGGSAFGPHSQSQTALPDDGTRGFGSQMPPRSNDMALSLIPGGPGGSLASSANSSSSTSKESSVQAPPVGQVLSLHKPVESSPHFPPSVQLYPQTSASYSQAQASLASVRPQYPLASGQMMYSQASTSQQPIGAVSWQLGSQNSVPQQVSLVPGLLTPMSTNLQPHTGSTPTNQNDHPAPVEQSPSQLAQMLSQQTQTLQASFQSSQQAFSQLQQQLQLMQPSNQASKMQFTGNVRHTVGSSTPAAADVSSSTPGAFTVSSAAQPLAPAKCDWTEHISPDGYNYYYNSVTGESRWEKPEQFALLEKQQQKQSVKQSQTLSFPPASFLSIPQNQHIQFQGSQSHIQNHQQLHLQRSSMSSSYQRYGVASLQNIQESQASQDWMWKNKPAGEVDVEGLESVYSSGNNRSLGNVSSSDGGIEL